MLSMDDIKYIKRMYETEGISMREINRRTGYHMETIKKYLELDDFNQLKKKQRNKPSKLDPLKPIIDSWLEEDLQLPRKYHHTAKRIYERLQNEYSDELEVKLRTVQYYVAKKKKELRTIKSKAFIPLSHPAGDAQVDFGEILYLNASGNRKKAKKLTVSFPHSNASYFQVFKSENQECLLQGLKNIFEHIKKVPNRLVFDNLSAAVSHIGKGKNRTLTDGFERFQLHYNFEAVFCNPASGWEKGNVENKVGYERRNLFVPIPVIENFDDFNKTLFDKSEKDMLRVHYKKDQLIKNLFKVDLKNMKNVNPVEFNVGKLVSVKTDKYAKVSFESNKYSTSPKYALERIYLEVTYNKVTALSPSYKIIVTHDRIYDKNKESMQWIPYIDLVRKRPNALKYTGFYEQLPNNWQYYLDSLNRKEKQEALLTLKKILKNRGIENARDALAQALENGVKDSDSIIASFNNLTQVDVSMKPLKLQDYKIKVPTFKANPLRYDKLLEGGGSNA